MDRRPTLKRNSLFAIWGWRWQSQLFFGVSLGGSLSPSRCALVLVRNNLSTWWKASLWQDQLGRMKVAIKGTFLATPFQIPPILMASIRRVLCLRRRICKSQITRSDLDHRLYHEEQMVGGNKAIIEEDDDGH